MSGGVIDAREHRRGLVLGLTLAEVLLLLLFVLLLALSAELTRFKAKQLAQISSLERENAELTRLNSDLVARDLIGKSLAGDVEKVRQLAHVLNLASEIDPTDPPALLRRALAVMEKLGPNTRPEQVKSLSEMMADSDKLAFLQSDRDRIRR